jgi:DNA-binding NtrC family response regulator
MTKPSRPTRAIRATRTSSTEAGAGRRVLVVNDTQEILELFEEILTEMGLEVTLMSFAPRELAQIRELNPDLVILDFVFGEREALGWQLLQKMRMDRSLEQVPVVVCTAAIKMVSELEGYLTEQGVVVVLKPFNVDQLEEAVRNALSLGGTAAKLRRRARKGGAPPARIEAVGQR